MTMRNCLLAMKMTLNCQILFADSLPLVKTHFMNNIVGMN